MKIINRVLVVILSFLIIAAVFDQNYLAIAALLAIPLGFLQLLYCISLGLKWETLKIKQKYFVGIYLLTVLAYFIFLFKSSNVNFNSTLVEIILLGLPILLAFSLTVFWELNNKDA
ncbi:hypothetical protein [Tenacibaculum geojense]|uniref:Uncharacterized protein n=1 Tax=Tenacibaculum geojense TaxID=915352 RepID=A0ABW3JS27_9FLAO